MTVSQALLGFDDLDSLEEYGSGGLWNLPPTKRDSSDARAWWAWGHGFWQEDHRGEGWFPSCLIKVT